MLYLVEGPPTANPVVTLAEAKVHCHVDHDDEDALIQACIDAVVQQIDGRDGFLGRALVRQTWELRLDGFCEAEIRIPLPPLLSVESFQYYDVSETLQTVSANIYQVAGVRGSGPARISLLHGHVWPETACRREAVIIRFKAGHLDPGGDPAGSVPAPIKTAVLMMVGTLYMQRETINIGNSVNDISVEGVPIAAGLLSPYRVPYFG